MEPQTPQGEQESGCWQSVCSVGQGQDTNIKEVKQTMQAYCMKCRAKREMKNPKPITMKNGRPATTGTCPVCGTKMFRIGGA